jgi:CubicO group peptidase (beta-lactamase class C family)
MLPGKRHVVRLITVVMLSLASLHAAAEGDEAANRKARQFLQETMQQRHIPGVQVAVVRGERVVLSESLGLANVENAQPVSATTRFPINSATKAFTGVAMMQLVEAGKVDLDAPLSRYLQDVPPAWRGIRIRQLLAHTSGLPDIVDAQGLVGGGSEAEAWKAVTAMPVLAAPGERFIYNQTNYLLLSRIIEALTAQPYSTYLATRQFAVVGMPRSTFGDSYDLVPGAATMYSRFPRSSDAADQAPRLSHWFYDMPHGLWAGGGMQTTADEVARWLIALSRGQLISKQGVAQMWMPESLNDGTPGDWAAGWPVSGPAGQRRIASMGGARAAFIVYPDDDLAVVVLTNLVGANPQEFIPQIGDFYR